MPAAVPLAPERSPRRARYLIPLGTPRRAEVLGAAGVAAVAASALFAPLTLVLAVAFHGLSTLTRWRPVWLCAPAACGVAWALAAGPRSAAAGFGHGPSAVAAVLSRVPVSPAGVARLPGVVAGGLGGQFPLALILAAAAAAGAWWIRWMHTDEWDVPAYRLGPVGLGRRRRTVASVRAGRIVTRDGACLGVDEATGGQAALNWRDAGGGVLVTGAARPAVLASGLQLAHAAIRRRKPVIVVDLAGHPELPGALAAICAAARAPLHRFGAAGGARYEPRVRPDEGQQAALRTANWAPGPAAGAKAGLDEVVRQRGVALFSLDRPGSGEAEAIAGLVAADIAGIYAGLDLKGVAPDGLCWLTECAGVDPGALACLIAAGRPDGLVPVLATTVPATAGGLARQAGAAILYRLGDWDLAAELAPMTGTAIRPIAQALAAEAGEGPVTKEQDRRPPGGFRGAVPPGQQGYAAARRTKTSPAVPLGTTPVPVVPAEELCALGDGDFVLITGLPAARTGGGRRGGATVRARCRAVTASIPGWPAPPGGPPATRWAP